VADSQLEVYFRITRPDTGFNPFYGSATVTINPRQLTWDRGSSSSNPATVNNKVYNGTTNATVLSAPTLAGVIGTDVITVTAGTVVFNSANAANGIVITAAGWGIGGTGLSNYIAPTVQPVFANADITPLQLTWSTGSTVNNKVYDGTTGATVLNAPTLVGIVGTDAVTVTTGTVVFNSANAANGIGITAVGWSIGGAATGNYIAPVAQPVFANANITRLQLTWSTGSTVSNKVYDGTTSATVQSAPTLVGVVGSDAVTVTTGTVVFNSANAGNNIGITAAGWGIGRSAA